MTKQKNNTLILIGAILLPLAVGGLSTLLSGGMNDDFKMPPLYPPKILFPIVWTLIYISIGYASYLVFTRSDHKINDALKAYFYQLFINFLWPIVFFRFNYYTTAAVFLVVLIILVISVIIEFKKADKTASRIFIPYLAWCVFALYLNIGVAILN